MQTPQPASLVDEIFARIAVRYGAAWAAMWTGLDVAVVKADWAHQLGGMSERALRYGIVNLPLDRPPNAAQFKAICLRAPEPETPRLSHRVKADPERLAKARAALDAVLARKAKQKRREWAVDMSEREKAGEPLTETQRNAWRNAMRANEVMDGAISLPFKAPPPESLPPGGLRPEP